MPALDSLPAPALLGGNGRWSQLPPSQNVQMELITRARQNLTASILGSTTSTKILPSPTPPLPRVLPKTDYANLGELIGQEQLAGTSQMLCHYRNNSAANLNNGPIPLVCQLGCCPHVPGGCCTLDESINAPNESPSSIASISSAYHWVLILLCAFIICVFLSTLAMMVLYFVNRRQDARRRRFLLAEKFSLGIGSASRPSSYGAPSMASSGPNPQPPFCAFPPTPHHHHQLGQFRQFYSSTNSPGALSAADHRRQQFGPPPHLLRPYGPPPPANGSNSSPASSSSAYHAPDEVFFRSSF